MPKRKRDHPFVAIVGHIVKDDIVSVCGEERVALGGIAYNLAALCMLMSAGTIYPICRIGYDVEGLMHEAFGASPIFDDSGIVYSNRPNIVNRLTYAQDGSRQEWNSGKPSPMHLADVPLEADVVIINFISGCDVRLSDLKEFRRRYSGIIYCDYHSLSLGRDNYGNRYHRFHPRWKEYLSPVDIVQMNALELSSIVRRELNDTFEIAHAVNAIHQAGPDIVIITLGDRGVIVSDIKAKQQIIVPAINLTGKTDPTGCGDTLGATFIHNYLQDNNIIKSIEIANHYAAAKATFTGLDGFGKMGEISRSIGPPAKAEKI